MANKKLPSARDVAATLYTDLHNSGPGTTMLVSDRELAKEGDRKHCRMAYKVGVEDHLRSLGCEVTATDGQRMVHIPTEANIVSRQEAKTLSSEAQETGWRSSPGCTDNLVISKK